MRRPSKTPKQRDYDRTQRALLRLRRAAVRFSDNDDGAAMIERQTDLHAAADAFTTSLSARERRKLAK